MNYLQKLVAISSLYLLLPLFSMASVSADLVSVTKEIFRFWCNSSLSLNPDEFRALKSVEQAHQNSDKTKSLSLKLVNGGSITLSLSPGRFTRAVYLDDRERERLNIQTRDGCTNPDLRRLNYLKNQLESLEILDFNTLQVSRTVPLNPQTLQGDGYSGIRVAMVDSGINYLIPQISERLARDDSGKVLGYDFWDSDPLPFDINVGSNKFYPRHHGTRTASLLLDESPFISLVPYRYPRPNMSRMADLVAHASSLGVAVIGLPLGSGNVNDWIAFKQAMHSHPEILFVVSAGNEGLDLDITPRYPASFSADNLIVVGSVDENPKPASRTNWSSNHVDILVPAERLPALGFDGEPRIVSGTSYAVSRVVALASRLIQLKNITGASLLKDAIVSMANPEISGEFARFGLLADPLADVAQIKQGKSILNKLESGKETSASLTVSVLRVDQGNWPLSLIDDSYQKIRSVFEQCNVHIDFETHNIKSSNFLWDFHSITSKTLLDSLDFNRPAIFLVRDTLRRIAFEGEAFGIANSVNLPWLANTAWIISGIKNPGLVMAHELIHVILDNGQHNRIQGNLMQARISPNNTKLSDQQCTSLIARLSN